MFCIDVKIVEFLKDLNASELVNRLLLEHMDHEALLDMTKEELLAEKAVNKLNKDTEAKIKEIRKDARK